MSVRTRAREGNMFVDRDAGDLLVAISLVLRKPVRGEWF